jgi:uncharacterized repeat protein (TIGR01451 family)
MDVVFTIVVTNSGDTDLVDVVVSDTLPDGFTYKTGSSKVNGVASEPFSIVGNLITWKIGDLNSDDSATITYTATVGTSVTAGTYSNTAVASGFGPNETPVTSDKVHSDVVVKVPAVLSETTETPAVLPMTNEGNGPELPIWPLLLITTGSVLKLVEKLGRKTFEKAT